MNDTLLKLPNIITMIRIVLIVPFFILTILGKTLESLLVFTFAALTDVLDGQVARLLKMKTRIGSALDPAADKLLMMSAFIVLSLPSINSVNTIPIWLTAVVIGRDILMVSGYFAYRFLRGEVSIVPSLLGKTSTVLQAITVSLVLLLNSLGSSPEFLNFIYFLTLIFTLLSFLHYALLYTFRPPQTDD
ncbi:MAG: CDP-alcohol phosphatidyltransferase family protein [Candidatus Aminicenantales bacterium]